MRDPRTAAWVVLISACYLALASGCERQRHEAPSVTDSASAAESTPVSQPANVRVDVAAPADADDDPKAPRVFPRSNQLKGWVKTTPIRVNGPDKAREVLGKTGNDLLNGIELKELAYCRYEHAGAQVQVVFIEAASPADALSLFTFETGGLVDSPRPDGSIRVRPESGGSPRLCNWQGRCYLELSGEWTDQKAVEQLADRILFPLEAADAPLLLKAIPTDQRARCRLWAGRSARMLKQSEDERLTKLNADEVNRSLGLDGKATLTVAAIPPQQSMPSALIWLVTYPSAKEASEAYTRCSAASADSATRVLPAIDRNLLGSWTASDKPVQDLLAALHAGVAGPTPVRASMPAPLPTSSPSRK